MRKNFSIFPVFLNRLNIGLPKCKVVYSIRQSFLYTKTGENQLRVDDYVSKNYPLTYYYIEIGHATSFYYVKNNLIEYYIHSGEDKHFYVVPLYKYNENNYDLILSPLLYNPNEPYTVYIVKTPNRQVCVVRSERGLLRIVNVSKGTLLYEYEFSYDITHLFHSMPIANSFILVVRYNAKGKEISIYIIDLIKGKKYIKKYSVKK